MQLTSFADVFSYLATRYTLAAGGASSVELWWKLDVAGEHVVQHQIIHVDEREEGLAVTITSEVHCLDPIRVLRLEPTIWVGAVVFEAGRPLLRQPLVASVIEAAHLDRVMDAVAREAARLAHEARREDRRAG